METPQRKTPVHVLVQQTNNNTTAWIGHQRSEDPDHIAGQTFICPAETDLAAIEIFSTLVTKAGHARISIHPFDPQTHQWGPVLHSTSIEINTADNNKWIAFPQTGLHLHKGATYGFRLESDDMLLGIGEAAGSVHHPPFSDGQEYVAHSRKQAGVYYRYLSLAFKVEAA